MANKTYRSANNRTVDMETLRLKNENVRAVGNMGVNARGDRIDNNNKTVDARTRRVARQYKKQTNVVDEPVAATVEEAKNVSQYVSENEAPELHIDISATEDNTNIEDGVSFDNEKSKENPEEPQGLAAAIARAREVKQEEVVPPRKASQQKPGVKKI